MKRLILLFALLSGCGQEEPSEPKEPETKGKVKKGMTKQQVVEAIGEPESVAPRDTFIWYWYPEIFCAGGGNCYIEIDPKTDKVVSAFNMKSKYVDTTSF